MPIGSIHKTGNSFRGAAEYVLSEGRYKDDYEEKKPSIILKYNLLFDDAQQLGMEFRNLANFNTKVKKPVFHFSINFDRETQETKERQLEFIKRILDLMDINSENHQVLVAEHHDKHSHYHVIMNRVGMNGITYSDKFSKNKLELCIDRAEKELGIDNSLSEVRRFTYNPKNEKGYDFKKVESNHKGKTIIKESKNKKLGIKNKQNKLKEIILKVLESGVISTQELQIELKKYEVDFQFSYNVNGLAKTSFRYDGYAVKGFSLGLKAKFIEEQLHENVRASIDRDKKNQINDTFSKISKVVSDIDKQYEKGDQLEPGFYENLETIFINDENIGFEDLRKIIEENDIQFIEKKKDYDLKLNQYLAIQKEKPKSFLKYFETAQQKEYNKELDLKKQESMPIFSFNGTLKERIKNRIEDSLRIEVENLDTKNSLQFIKESEYLKKLKKYQDEVSLIFTSLLKKELQVQSEFIDGKEQVRIFKDYYGKFVEIVRPNIAIHGFKNREVFTSLFMIEELFTIFRIELGKKIDEYSETHRFNKEIESELSIEGIDKYKEIRSRYNNQRDYIEKILLNYEHEGILKDLFWLDKKLYSLETDNERARYLQYEFGLSNKAADSLVYYFFDENEKVLEMKIKCLNSLPDRLIRGKDKIPTQDRSQQNYLGK